MPLTPVAASMATSGAQFDDGVTGEAISQGEAIAKLASNGKWYKANAAGNAAIAGSGGLGIAMTTAAGVDQPVRVFRRGLINLGTTLDVGEPYCVYNVAGQMAERNELAAVNTRISLLGVAVNTSWLQTVPAAGMWATGAQID